MFSNLSDSSAIRFDFPQMKAYPSVYSANNGNMHTEETVRWLTKKISSKSFIAATDKDKFYIDCDALAEYASEGRGIGISPVSMSIDGYQIKKGSPSEVSFDVYDNEPMILNISKQCDFVNELVNQSTAISTDINNIVYNAYKTTTANYLQNWYSLENSDEDIVIGRVKVTYNDQTFLNQLTYNSGTPGYIFYDSNDKIIAYTSEESAPISDETTIPFAVVTGSPITSVDLYYPVLYSKKRYLSNNKTKLNSYPIIKFTDIFGFDFIRTVSVGMTKTYPSAHSFTDYETNCAGSIPLLSDYIPQVSAYISSLNEFSNGLTSSTPEFLYDFTEYYDSNVRSSKVDNNPTGETSIGGHGSELFNTDAVFDLISNANSGTLLKSLIPTGSSARLETNLSCFCIKDITTNLQEITVDGVTKQIPVCFMTSDGNLCPTGLPRYESDSDTVPVVKGTYPVEGYVHYINRMYLEVYKNDHNLTEDKINSVTVSNLSEWQRASDSDFADYFTPIEKCISLYLQFGYSACLEAVSGETMKQLRYCGTEVSGISGATSSDPSRFYELPGVVNVTKSGQVTTKPYSQRFMVNDSNDYNKLNGKMIASSTSLIDTTFIEDSTYNDSFTVNEVVSSDLNLYIDDPINYFRKCAKRNAEDNTLTMKVYQAQTSSNAIKMTEVSSVNCDPYASNGATIANVSVSPCLIPYTDSVAKTTGMTNPYVNTALSMTVPKDICMTYYNQDAMITGCSGFSFEYNYESWACEVPFITIDVQDGHRYLIGSYYENGDSNKYYGGIDFSFNTWKEINPQREQALLFGTLQIGTDYTNIGCNVETPYVNYDMTDLKSATQRNAIINVDNVYADVDKSLCEYIVDVVKNSVDFIVYSGQCGDDVFFNVYMSGLIRIYGTGDMWDYNPSQYVHMKNPFMNFTLFNRLIVEDGVTRIGTRAFRRCYGLASVTLSDTVEEIGFDAFVANSNYFDARGSLVAINIPNSVTTIEQSAFSNTAIKSVSVPNSVTTVGDYAFAQCSKLTSVHYAASAISDMEFSRCGALTEFTLETSTTAIGSAAFAYCTSLKEIVYNGTKNQFDSITKSANWDSKKTTAAGIVLPVPAGDSALDKITCTDGYYAYSEGSWTWVANS